MKGASTLISRAKSETQVLKRKGFRQSTKMDRCHTKSVKEEYVDK